MKYWNYRRLWFVLGFVAVATLLTVSRVYVENDEMIQVSFSSPQKFLPSRIFDFAEKSKLHDWNCSVSQVLRIIDTYDDLQKFSHCQRVFYNRVPKCGSRTLLNLFSNLSYNQNYSLYSDSKISHLSKDALISFVKNFTHLDSPYIYSRHIHFVNFTKFDIPPPIYINVIRDPLERLISHYHYNMYGSSNAPLSTPRPQFNMSLAECVKQRKGTCMGKFQTVLPYFCSMDKKCRSSADAEERLAQAKRTVRENFLVVGITEDLAAFVEVLETLMPHFFKDAGKVFSRIETDLWNKTKTITKAPIDRQTEAVLKDFLAMDYEFYDFVRQRFYTLLEKIRSLKRDQDRKQKRHDMIDRDWSYIYDYH